MGRILKAIPTVDLGAFHEGSTEARRRGAAALDQALSEVGFFLLTGHGVLRELIEGVHETARLLFEAKESVKRAWEPQGGGLLGYRGLNSVRSSTADASGPPDLRERFAMGPPGGSHGSDPAGQGGSLRDGWPLELEERRQSVVSYYQSMVGLSSLLMRAFAVALGREEGFFEDQIDRSVSYLVLLGYPGQREPPLPRQMRAGSHRDRSCLTILTADSPGLQVLLGEDTWLDVHCEKDVFIVNAGSMLERWTGERWVSALHRVANPPAQTREASRQSIAFFFNPNDDVVLEPLTLGASAANGEVRPPAPVTVREYLRTMLDLHSKR